MKAYHICDRTIDVKFAKHIAAMGDEADAVVGDDE